MKDKKCKITFQNGTQIELINNSSTESLPPSNLEEKRSLYLAYIRGLTDAYKYAKIPTFTEWYNEIYLTQ